MHYWSREVSLREFIADVRAYFPIFITSVSSSTVKYTLHFMNKMINNRIYKSYLEMIKTLDQWFVCAENIYILKNSDTNIIDQLSNRINLEFCLKYQTLTTFYTKILFNIIILTYFIFRLALTNWNVWLVRNKTCAIFLMWQLIMIDIVARIL